MTNYNKLNRTIKALTIVGLFLFAFMTGIAYLYSLCMAMLDLAYMAVIVSPYMAIMACLNWSNLQECRFNRLFDPLTLWILTMQLNWYRCNLVKPITCMAAIVWLLLYPLLRLTCLPYWSGLLIRLVLGCFSLIKCLCGQLYPSYLHGLIWLIIALYDLLVCLTMAVCYLSCCTCLIIAFILIVSHSNGFYCLS